MAYVYLLVAILAEVIATNALKATDSFTKLGPSIIVIVGYSVAFYFLSLVLKTMPIGVAYAIWSGLGVILVTVAAAYIFKQVPDTPAVIGIFLIVLGVAVIHLFSDNL